MTASFSIFPGHCTLSSCFIWHEIPLTSSDVTVSLNDLWTNKLTNNLQHFIIVSLVAETSTGCILGGSALGGRQLKAEQVGEKAADELLQSISTGACVDSYSQDQVTLNFHLQTLLSILAWWVSLLLFVLEVPSLNLSQENYYPDWGILWSSSVALCKFVDNTWSGPSPLPSQHSQSYCSFLFIAVWQM